MKGKRTAKDTPRRGRPPGSKNKPKAAKAKNLGELKLDLVLDTANFERKLDEIEGRVERLRSVFGAAPPIRRRGRPSLERNLG